MHVHMGLHIALFCKGAVAHGAFKGPLPRMQASVLFKIPAIKEKSKAQVALVFPLPITTLHASGGVLL